LTVAFRVEYSLHEHPQMNVRPHINVAMFIPSITVTYSYSIP
jgi:hypothetical protein